MSQRGGHTLRPAGAQAGRRAPMWVSVSCAGCGSPFTANAYTVPVLGNPDTGGGPACRGCWRRLNLIRRSANMPEWDTPEDAYPDANPGEVRDQIGQVRPC